MSPASIKTNQFSDLLKFFDSLASHRSKTGPEASEEHIVNIEDDIPTSLQPVLRNLASLVDRRAADDTGPRQASTTRGRRNTVASTTSLSSCGPSKSVDRFTAGKEFPFTFKMMLHKLYELEEWGKKVKDVLEKSQRQYKPLKESNGARETVEEQVSDGALTFATGSTRQLKLSTAKRGRSHSVTGGKLREQVNDAETAKPPCQKEPISVRAAKKRCVGRRKSTTALQEGGGSGLGGWVYDSAIVSVDANGKNSTRRRRRASVSDEGEQEVPPTTRPVRKRRARVFKVFNTTKNDELTLDK